MNKEQLKNSIADFLREKREIAYAYIFGSFVQKQYYHDIDVAVYLGKNFDKNDLIKFPYSYESQLISELNILVRKNIDLVVMNSAEILIQQRIINKGILLFSRDESARIFYENYVRKLYIDSEHLRMIKRHYLAKNIIDA